MIFCDILVKGFCDTDLKEIYISIGLSDWMKRRVLKHELCHAYVYELHICTNVHEEEKICNLVANWSSEIDMQADKILKS